MVGRARDNPAPRDSIASSVVRTLAVAVVLLSLLTAGRITWAGYGPGTTPATVRAQVRFLQSALQDGAAPRMQQLFPEGAFFLTALTGSAAAHSGDLDTARVLRDRLDAPDLVATFGAQMTPTHGIFHAGWSLSTAVDVAEVSGDRADRAAVERLAADVDAAFRSTRTGFLEGYPGQFWPCDSVVGASALARAAVLLERLDWLRTVRTWRDRVNQQLDPATGLLPHQVDRDGRPLTGPRGSSQAVIQTFWPAIAQSLGDRPDPTTWSRFTTVFVTREAGLVGVREYPPGQEGAGDVDSGPLVLGVSVSASAVTLAAARTVGDTGLATSLDREAELFGLPAQWDGRRRYAFGLLPIGDAFVAWARSRTPVADRSAPVTSDSPAPRWPAHIGLALLPAALVSGIALAVPRRRGRITARSGSESPPQ